ncbi:MAG: hypothetical protein ACTSUG_17660 [Candidatus Helarchaeota archaeon]
MIFIKVSSTERTFAGVGKGQCSCVNEELFIASTICNKRRDIVELEHFNSALI